LISIYKKTTKTTSVCEMSIESAEITKIALNSYCTLKISFANSIMRIADRIKTANAGDICNALGKDRRISPYYFKPGLPFSGPCFPRDNQAFSFFQKKIGIKSKLISDATIKNNKEHKKFLNEKILKFIKQKKIKSILILGVSFKNTTFVTNDSYGLDLINLLKKKKISFEIFEKNINIYDENYKKYKKYLITKNIYKKKYDLIINTNQSQMIKAKYKYYLNCWNL
jgi:UDPglucose 6-dehydrogenase